MLISSWLNTSKDPVVGNEQKAGAFWKRIAAYFAASPRVERGEKREAMQCKQRWQKINDFVCKFSRSYEAATRHKTSGMNENGVVKATQQIFYKDYKMNLTFNMLGKSCSSTRNGVNSLLVRLMEPLRREGVRTVLNHLALKQLPI